jgi:acyl-ACP thioesterase
MLSRIDIRIEAMPGAGQRVIARTWPVAAKKLYAQRCLELLDESGFRYVGAMYEYIIVDVQTRRVVRPERTLPIDLTTNYPWPFDDLSPGVEEVQFGALEEFSEAFALEARARHIDQNGHVNNAHFINWLCDAVPRADGETPCRIKVDFVHEILKGGKVSALIKPAPAISSSLSRKVLNHAEGVTSLRPAWFSALTCDGILAARGMIELDSL